MTRARMIVLLCWGIFVSTGCAPAGPSPSGGSAAPSIAVAATSTLAPSASPAPAPTLPSARPTTGPPAFVLPTPPPASSVWTGVTWRKLSPGDPLGQVRSVHRWSGGFVAVGDPVVTGETSRSPVWVSSDGAAWQALPEQVFGPGTVVLGIVDVPTGLVAMTLSGGQNQCDGDATPLSCWTVALPLRAWTSADGTAWTAHPGPDITLAPMFEGSPGVDPPVFVGGRAGALVAVDGTTGAHASVSTDGITWLPSATVPIPTISGFYANAAAFGPDFVAVGRSQDETGHGVVISSRDGRAWATRSLPTTGFARGWIPKGVGSRASRLVAGSAGLIAVGGTFLAPGAELWWSSLDGRTWKTLPKFQPLGIWVGDAEGSGSTPNGVLAGDGERFIAYRSAGKDAGWTSFDGRTWHRLALGGADVAQPTRDPVLMPGGILWFGGYGSTWFGEPST